MNRAARTHVQRAIPWALVVDFVGAALAVIAWQATQDLAWVIVAIGIAVAAASGLIIRARMLEKGVSRVGSIVE